MHYSSTTEPYKIDYLSLHDALPILDADSSHRDDVREDVRGRGRPAARRHGPHGLRRRYRGARQRSEEHTSELQSLAYLVCRLLLEKENMGEDIVCNLVTGLCSCEFM